MENALRTAKLAKLTCEMEPHQDAPYCEELAWAVQLLGLEIASVSEAKKKTIISRYQFQTARLLKLRPEDPSKCTALAT
jgi:hypothetical protein